MWEDLFDLPKDYWLADAAENRKWVEEQVGGGNVNKWPKVFFQVGPDLPKEIRTEMNAQEERIKKI